MDLATTWFLLVGVLIAGYAVLDGFDLGVGVLSLFSRSDREQRIHLNAIGPVWDGNEVWLLTAGGALFAAFPAVYATVFSGFYVAFMLLLLALMARAVSFEFRSKVESAPWRRAWDLAFGLGSLVAAVLFGVALGNVARGVPLGPDGEFAGTFLGLLNPLALLAGFLTLALSVAHGAAWLRLKTEGDLLSRVERWLLPAQVAWGALWVLVVAWSLVASPALGSAFLGRPLAWIAALVAAGAWGATVGWTRKGQAGRAFFASSLTIVAQVAVLGACLYPTLVPALGDPSLSLTVHNSASTPRTLGVMLAIALAGMPLVVAYTAFIYRVFKGKVVLDEHSY